MIDSNKRIESLFELLPRVERPPRYTGGEANMVRKDPREVGFRAVLIYPDLYEIGMSNLGLRLLYDILNRRPGVYAERAFHPWVDMEAEMRRAGLPLWSLETFTPVREFDLVGFSLGTELVYTNVLNILDLAGIPLRSAQRGEGDPLVAGGGICVYNPEPLADFFDFFLIGDGEEALPEIVDRLIELRGESREGKLRVIAGIPGVYVPSLYRAVYAGDGAFARLEPVSPEVRGKIARRILPALGSEYQIKKPLVPLLETIHDRLTVEIMRGCTRGCRFCLAGMVYRPVRELPAEVAGRTVRQGLDHTGWEEVSLVSLSSADYSDLLPLLEDLCGATEPGRIAVSLPSQRPDAFTGEMADALKVVKRTGLTFAVEAASERLRRVINKDISDEDILRIAGEVIERDWRLIKFYFMIGLPTETEGEVDGIEHLVRAVYRLGRSKHRRFRLNVNVSPFVPKPHTPFQWVAQEGIESLAGKGRRLRDRLSERAIRVKLADPQSSFIEGVLSRGDRRVGAAIEEAWREGARLDGWSRFFRIDLWRRAFEKTGIDPYRYTAAVRDTARLPWEHIDIGVSNAFLEREWKRARECKTTPDCRVGPCQVCGLFPLPVRGVGGDRRPAECPPPAERATSASGVRHGRGRRKAPRTAPVPAAFRFRLKYAKLSRSRFLGHLDTVRALTRALRMLNLPLAYSRGHSPHPRVAFGPPLPFGLESESEYFDVQFERAVDSDLAGDLNRVLPEGLRVIESRAITGSPGSLVAGIQFAAYRAEWPNGRTDTPDGRDLKRTIPDFFARHQALYTRPPRGDVGKAVTLDLRPLVHSADLLERQPPEMRLVLSAAPGRTARPLEVLETMLGRPVEPGRPRMVREELFRLEPDGEKLTPMDPGF